VLHNTASIDQRISNYKAFDFNSWIWSKNIKIFEITAIFSIYLNLKSWDFLHCHLLLKYTTGVGRLPSRCTYLCWKQRETFCSGEIPLFRIAVNHSNQNRRLKLWLASAMCHWEGPANRSAPLHWWHPCNLCSPIRANCRFCQARAPTRGRQLSNRPVEEKTAMGGLHFIQPQLYWGA